MTLILGTNFQAAPHHPLDIALQKKNTDCTSEPRTKDRAVTEVVSRSHAHPDNSSRVIARGSHLYVPCRSVFGTGIIVYSLPLIFSPPEPTV